MRTIQKRPTRFDEMTGQNKILYEMKNRSKDMNFENHMMFYGKSGSGKSTTALILAKLLNCHNPVKTEDGHLEPCNECPACTDVLTQNYRRDVHYMDATYMGKEEVQKLHEKVATRPIRDKNKIFIIDEAHLLNSKEARGGMLTLSEYIKPNVYIILCTTDTGRFDRAFRSRFVEYYYKSISSTSIGEYLAEVMFDEGYKEEEILNKYMDVIGLIADNSDGSVRQALQYLERVLQADVVNEEEAIDLLGIISAGKVYELIDNLLSGNGQQFFTTLSKQQDLDYVFNYLNVTILGIQKALLGIEKYTPDNFKGKKVEIINKSYRKEFAIIFDTFQSLNDKMPGYYFNKRLFEFEILNYLDKINSIPKMTKNKPERIVEKRKPAKRRPVS